jgi:hypothetical protein
MNLWMVFSVIGYAGIALLFMIATFLEGGRKHLSWRGPRALGLGLCLVWPLVLIGLLIAVWHVRRVEEPSR